MFSGDRDIFIVALIVDCSIKRIILCATATMAFLFDLRTIKLRYLAAKLLLVMRAALAHSHRM